MEPSDAVLIERSLAGELDAFDALMARYQALVFKVAMTCARDRDEALDISQNAFLKAYEQLGSLRTGASFKSWVARIAYHESVNWARRHKRRGESFESPEVDRVQEPSPGPDTVLLTGERSHLLADRLGRLNPRYRLVVALRYFEELSTAEIAAILRCSEGLVKNMLFRSLRRLRQELVHVRPLS